MGVSAVTAVSVAVEVMGLVAAVDLAEEGAAA